MHSEWNAGSARVMHSNHIKVYLWHSLDHIKETYQNTSAAQLIASSLAGTLVSVFTFFPLVFSEGSAAAAKIKAFEYYFKARLAEYNLVGVNSGFCCLGLWLVYML